LTAALFRAPEKFLFGIGAIESLGEEALRFGRRALLVTGRRAMAEAGITDRCLAILRKAGIEADLFDEVEPEPDVAAVPRVRLHQRLDQNQALVRDEEAHPLQAPLLQVPEERLLTGLVLLPSSETPRTSQYPSWPTPIATRTETFWTSPPHQDP
jgi:hypothetical protein